MIESSFNMFDAGVLTVIGLSALLSFFRGFVRELFSLGSWLAATIITLYAFQPVSEWIKPQVGSQAVASGLASMGVFFASLVGLSILTGLLLKFMKSGNDVGVLDNLMGLVFGVARGALIVAIGYFVSGIFILEKDMPAYVKDAKTRPYVAKAALWVGKATPDYLNEIVKRGPGDPDARLSEDTAKRVQKIADDWRDAKEGLPEGTLPSMEDLQERIRQENEGR